MALAPEIRWGLLIGLANLVWLYGSFFLGMHTHGLAQVQVMTLIGFGITFAGYLAGLREVSRREGGISFVEGIRSGGVIAAVTAVFAAATQWGYFTFVHPGWTEFMMEETRRHYEEAGAAPEAIGEAVARAEVAFGLKNYLFQSVLGALVLGMVFTAVIMLFLRTRSR